MSKRGGKLKPLQTPQQVQQDGDHVVDIKHELNKVEGQTLPLSNT